MDTGCYDDIILLPHHVSATRPQMSRLNRAAQFAPFAALTGYGDAVREEARYTETAPELTEDEKAELNQRLQILKRGIQSEAVVLWFQPDRKKAGGKYVTTAGIVGKVDDYRQELVMEDGTAIPFDSLISVTGVQNP